jgi:hypothetical protein
MCIMPLCLYNPLHAFIATAVVFQSSLDLLHIPGYLWNCFVVVILYTIQVPIYDGGSDDTSNSPATSNTN